MSALHDRLRNDEGFTLIELMISMALLALVIGPITGSFLIGLLESRATGDRVVDSAGVQAVSSYLVGDIQSSQTVSTVSTCLPPEVTGGTVRLALSWVDAYDGDADDDSAEIAYVDLIDADGQHELYRTSCTSAGDEASMLVGNLAATDGLVATCGTVACSSTPSTPNVVKVVISLAANNAQVASSYKALTFSIEANRKVTS